MRELETSGQRVTVVGDGINDAPALATTHTGIAMGGAGCDLTLQTADAVVVRDDPGHHPRRHRPVPVRPPGGDRQPDHRRDVHHWSARVDLVGHLRYRWVWPGMKGSTVIVGLNGLRLLRRAAWRRAVRG